MVYLAKKDGGVVHHTSLEALKEMDGIEKPDMQVSDEKFEAAGSLARLIDGKIVLGKTQAEITAGENQKRIIEIDAELDDIDRKSERPVRVVYENPEMFDRVKRARAVWMLANSSYGHDLTGGFGYDRTGETSKTLDNKRAAFTVDYAIRLQRAQIERRDALRIIESRDVEDAFFYVDPPYAGTDQGHYDGYTQMDFDALLELLESIKGKFLLSSFRNKALTEFIDRNERYAVP